MERESIKIKTKKLIESKWFILILSALTFLCWLSRSFFLGTIVALIVFVLMEWSEAEFTPLISVYFLTLGGRSSYKSGNIVSVTGIISIVIISLLGVLLLYLVIKDIIKNFNSYKHKLSGDKVILGMLLLGAYMVYTLLYAPLIGSGVLYILRCFVILVFGVLAILKITKNKTNKELVMYSMIAVIYTIFFEFVVRFAYVATHIDYMLTARNGYYKEYESYHDLENALVCKELGLFWSVSNHYIIIVNIALVVAVYFILCYRNKKSNVAFASIGIVLALIMNYFCKCRAGYLSLAICGSFGLVATVIKNKSLRFKVITYTVLGVIGVIAAATVIYVITPDKILSYFNDVGSGRAEVFDVAIDQFKEHLTFGTGVGSSKYYLAKYCTFDYKLINYHNVILQVLSTLGIVGMVFFVYHIFTIVYRLWRNDLYSIMMLVILVYMFVNGMLDTIFFNWTFMIFFFVLLYMGEGRYKENRRLFLF